MTDQPQLTEEQEERFALCAQMADMVDGDAVFAMLREIKRLRLALATTEQQRKDLQVKLDELMGEAVWFTPEQADEWMKSKAVKEAKLSADKLKAAEQRATTAEADLLIVQRDLNSKYALMNIIPQLKAERDAALARVQALEQAATNLACEVKGAIGIEGPTIRESIGNTNYQCLTDRLQQVADILGLFKPPDQEGT